MSSDVRPAYGTGYPNFVLLKRRFIKKRGLVDSANLSVRVRSSARHPDLWTIRALSITMNGTILMYINALNKRQEREVYFHDLHA